MPPLSELETKTKILLVAFVDRLRENKKVHRAMAPFALKNYVWSFPDIRETYDIRIKAIDLQDNDEIILRGLLGERPAIVGFSMFFWTAKKSLNIARKLKLVRPSIEIMAGGPEVSAQLFREEESLDYAVRGEGEKVFLDFLRRRAAGRETDNIPGLMRRRNGEASADVEPSVLESLDEIPPLSKCRDFIEANQMTPEQKFPLEISRGCPYKCHYCFWNMHQVRFVPAETFKENFRLLMSGIPDGRTVTIDFIDSYLDIDVDRLKTYLKIMAEHKKPNAAFKGYFLLRRLDEELANLLEDAGFKHIAFGLQALGDEVLPALNRQWFKADTLDALIRLKDRFRVSVDLMYGLPGDSYENFRETMKALWGRGVDHIEAARLRVIPETHFYNEPEGHNLKFDALPRHMAFSSKTFPFEDIARADRLAINFSALRKLINRADLELLEEKFGLTPFDICEDIHSAVPGWSKGVSRYGEGCSDVAIQSDLFLQLGEYLKRRRPNSDFLGPIGSHLTLKQAQWELKTAMEEALNRSPAPRPADQTALAEGKTRIPNFRKLQLEHNVVGSNDNGSRFKRLDQPKSYFLFGNFLTGTIEIIESPNPEVAEIVFQLFSRPVAARAAIDLIAREVDGIKKESIAAFVDMLAGKGAFICAHGQEATAH